MIAFPSVSLSFFFQVSEIAWHYCILIEGSSTVYAPRGPQRIAPLHSPIAEQQCTWKYRPLPTVVCKLQEYQGQAAFGLCTGGGGGSS